MHDRGSGGNVAQVSLEIQGNIARITFDHIAARNAMTVRMYQQLKDICLELSGNPKIRVAILRGAGGKSFISGSDIAQFADFKDGQDGVRYEAGIDDYLTPLTLLPFPTIAVIDGMAVGGGLAIASCCDFRIASVNAKFGVPIARTLGNCLSAGNIAWLVAHLNINIVKRMLLLAEMISAQELVRHGYLLAEYEQDALSAQADQLAQQLIKLAPITQKSSKLVIARLLKHQLPDCDDLISETYGSNDFKNGVASFLKGEPPVWSGC